MFKITFNIKNERIFKSMRIFICLVCKYDKYINDKNTFYYVLYYLINLKSYIIFLFKK